ncbi:MAG: hypothetical protein HY791_23800 [Deltaproteobacteria bacterium]|nr:hypothetical protein [Deltaproteobacteria bacterium]
MHRVSVPEPAPGSSLIVLVKSGDVLDLTALDATSVEFAPRKLAEGAYAELLVYHRTSLELGISSGPIPIAEGAFSRALPSPDEVLSLDVDDGGWVPREASAIDLSELRLPSQCLRLDPSGATPLTLPTAQTPEVLAGMGTDALAVGRDGYVRLLSGGEARTLRLSPPLVPQALEPVLDTMILAGPGAYRTSFASLASSSTHSISLETLVPPEAERYYDLVEGESGAVYGLHSSGIDSILPNVAPVGTLPGRFEELLWLGPGEFLALDVAFSGGQRVARWADGAASDLPLGPNNVTAWTMVEGLGPVFGLDRGNFLIQNANGTLEDLLLDDLGFWILDVASHGGGFVFILSTGSVGQYLPGEGLCPLQQFSGTLRRARIAVLDSEILAAGEQYDGEHAVVFWLPFDR